MAEQLGFQGIAPTRAVPEARHPIPPPADWPWTGPLLMWLRDQDPAAAWSGAPWPQWLVRITLAGGVPLPAVTFAVARAARPVLAQERDPELRAVWSWVFDAVEGISARSSGHVGRTAALLAQMQRGTRAPTSLVRELLVAAGEPDPARPWARAQAAVWVAYYAARASRSGDVPRMAATVREHLPWSLWRTELAEGVQAAQQRQREQQERVRWVQRSNGVFLCRR